MVIRGDKRNNKSKTLIELNLFVNIFTWSFHSIDISFITVKYVDDYFTEYFRITSDYWKKKFVNLEYN